MVKKIWQFLQTNSDAIIVVELVVIISLIIKYFNVKLINDTLIPVAYLVSVLFIFKAFKENQKGNVIAIGKVLYDKFLNDIKSSNELVNQQEAIGHIFFYGEDRIELKSNDIYGMNSKVKSIMHLLQNIDEYKIISERIALKDESLMRSNENGVFYLAMNYTAVYRILKDFSGHMLKYWSIYQSIYENRHSIAQEHINLLVEELMLYFHAYILICEKIKDSQHTFNSNVLILNLNDFVLKRDDESKFLRFRFSKIYDEHFSWAYDRIKETEKKLLRTSQ